MKMIKRKINSRIYTGLSLLVSLQLKTSIRRLILYQACDEVLKSVEVSLTSFQKDLGAVSAEIETLQNRSIALNTKLENRRIVEKLLLPAVEELSIAPSIVLKISEDPIDQEWIKALEELERRTKVVKSKLHGPDQIVAVTDIKPLLDDLINKVRDSMFVIMCGQTKEVVGSREDKRLLRLPNQGFAITQH